MIAAGARQLEAIRRAIEDTGAVLLTADRTSGRRKRPVKTLASEKVHMDEPEADETE